MLSKNPNTHKSLFSITPALYTLPAIAHNISKYCTIIQHAHFFCNSNFENTYDSSILFYFGTGSTGAPVESQPHLRLTMSDNPLSVALPPSLPTTACFTNTGIKDVSMNEKTKEIGQEMNEFMSSIDSFHQDRFTPCFNSNPSPTLPFEEGVHDNGIKDSPWPKTTTKYGPKLTAFLMVDDPTSQDDTTLLSAAHFDYGRSPIPLIAACTKDIDIEVVPMTDRNNQKGTKIDQLLARQCSQWFQHSYNGFWCSSWLCFHAFPAQYRIWYQF